MSFSIQLTAEEHRLADCYAKLHAVSLSEAFKQALFEKIAEEYDSAMADEAYLAYLQNPKTYSHEEVGKMFGL